MPNVPPQLECHFGVPLAGAVLNAINYRLDAASVAFILAHSESKVLIVDPEFAAVAKTALAGLGRAILVVDAEDALAPSHERIGEITYEALLAEGDPAFEGRFPADEWDAICLNYTSGTTGNPKGVVYHHRGAALLALGNAVTWQMAAQPVYLWTLPMFHASGWCFHWTITALGGTHVCLRRVEAGAILRSIATHGVTHLCGAPIVMQFLLAGLDDASLPRPPHKVRFMVAAAPPPASVLRRMAEASIDVTHVYGLTEVYGPAVVCDWKAEWNELSLEEQAELKKRQGVNYPVLEDIRVADIETMQEVPSDGKTLGEVLLRGNVVMKGYLKNPSASTAAFAGGWFHSGDLGVRHPDGYVELKDRAKDIIISGGENISSIEVEGALYKHPAVAAVAVVARPDEKWGETPVAHIELKPGMSATPEEIVAHAKLHLAGYKVPRHVIFGELPKTSTGKIQKFLLRGR
jgi:fatty-acyl-CoA synthase